MKGLKRDLAKSAPTASLGAFSLPIVLPSLTSRTWSVPKPLASTVPTASATPSVARTLASTDSGTVAIPLIELSTRPRAVRTTSVPALAVSKIDLNALSMVSVRM